MAANFCTQCGSEIADGKRFCGRCGAAVTPRKQHVEAVSAAPDTSVSASQKPTSQVPAFNAAVAVPVREEPTTQPVPVQVEYPAEPSERHAEEPRYPYIISGDSASTEPEALAVKEITAAPETFVEASGPSNHRRFPSLLIGIGLAVLLIAAGVFGFYQWHKKSSEAAAVNTSVQTQTSSEVPSLHATPAAIAKPAAGTPSPVLTPAPTLQAKAEALNLAPQPSINKRVPPADTTTDSSMNTSPVPIERAAPAPVVREAPASLKSGVLHYSGPPVHFGEVVSFSGLPGTMLRFSFDHSFWTPRISHQPDGTQTLTLRSLSQQEQTQCEVRWEVMQ